jgi:uncharacterized membrane protein
MWGKVLLNVLYNICIVLCGIFVYYSVQHGNWPYALAGAFLGVMIIIFKLRLVKNVKNMQKKP